MEENTKITFAKNLNKLNFNSTITIPIDSNVHIKSVVDVNAYTHDEKVECGNGKALISGKISVKVLYIDTDNMTNTVYDTQNFSETYLDNSITTDTYLNITNSTITNTILSTDGSLKLNCDVNISPIAYLNLNVSNNIKAGDMMITRKNDIVTNCISSVVNTKFDYVSNLETKNDVGKILCLNSYFVPEKINAQDGFAIVEGKLSTCVLYECINEGDSVIKEIKETSNIKCDVEIEGLTKDSNLDLSFAIDKSCEEVQADVEDDNNIITIKHKICVSGVVLKSVTIDVVDDLYSVENAIETNMVKREFTKNAEKFSLSEAISNEINLSSDEPAIDEVVANLNISPEITNTYIKNNSMNVEGIVSSNLTYIDENKELKHKQVETPFIIDTKIPAETLGCVHHSISVVDSKVKIKRGTIIEMEYTLFINLTVYEKESHEIVDSFSIGKPLDFSKYDFQIFVGKPNESMWELCKRIKIAPDEIHRYNKDLPLVLNGGEKIVIKR